MHPKHLKRKEAPALEKVQLEVFEEGCEALQSIRAYSPVFQLCVVLFPIS